MLFSYFLGYYPLLYASINSDELQAGLKMCSDLNEKVIENRSERIINPRIKVSRDGSPEILIVNATIWDGDGIISYNSSIHLKNGLIHSLNEIDSFGFLGTLINANGRFVTPGIVDMHSHMGLLSWPGFYGNSDANEGSQTLIHPELKSIDGFNPWDKAIPIINSGGVTTALVLPGSGGMMGGEAFGFKTSIPSDNRSESMLLNFGLNGTGWRWMKMACGENPIRSGRSSNIPPDSRLGEAYLFRKRIDDAFRIKTEQDTWCKQAATNKMNSPFPNPIEEESLISLLRGKTKLNVHCYETYDMEMMIRLGKEFNFNISAFHHALEAWRVPDLLYENNIGAAIFTDNWGYKKEAFGASVKAAQILSSKGVLTALKSDHPVLNSQNLIFEAAKAVHYGLNPSLAIKAVTSSPAKLMGQDHRIGYIRKGFDADVVMWNSNPLEVGSNPLVVIVDGSITFKHSLFNNDMTKFAPSSVKVPIVGPTISKPVNHTDCTYINIKGLISDKKSTWEKNSTIVVKSGLIVCMGPKCVPSGDIVNLNEGWVVPGLIAAGVNLGMQEISAEPSTSAGYSTRVILPAWKGLNIGLKYSKKLSAAFNAGFTTCISQLLQKGAIGSISVAFRTGQSNLSEKFIIKKEVAAHYFVGDDAKLDGLESSIPGQIQLIQEIHQFKNMTRIISVDSASYMHTLMDDADVFLGAAGAHAIANDLYNNNISVILSEARCIPDSWFNQDCLVAGTVPSAYQKLKNSLVNVGISTKQDGFIRGLIWEAGWLVSELIGFDKMNDFERAKEAISLLTWNIAEAFSLDHEIGFISLDKKPNFVVYDDVPGTLQAKVRYVIDGELIEVNTEQF